MKSYGKRTRIVLLLLPFLVVFRLFKVTYIHRSLKQNRKTSSRISVSLFLFSTCNRTALYYVRNWVKVFFSTSPHSPCSFFQYVRWSQRKCNIYTCTLFDRQKNYRFFFQYSIQFTYWFIDQALNHDLDSCTYRSNI